MLALLLSRRSARIVTLSAAAAALTKGKTELMGMTVAATGMLKSEIIGINVVLSVFIHSVDQLKQISQYK